ncbi:MauE/DoxX family redox-associated membrane protein [Mesonia sp.]|uniref:heavy-metal-associated domain-containing protein n=1 Tax=Mesonia sp. TaxID=1960830 RepID=UPI0017552F82|nr:MauE/DoxX family redox-associated membrane protein [Mesonia sp.]HIB36873.1 heavy metal transporter [Mesonia sp.]HIO26996.1 heavy metal transporter [Flavobacteriaceae bacterium]
MKHTYHISGMTCNGCRSSVEEKLNAVEGVKTAEVNLEKEEANIEMKRHITVKEFQKALPDKYKITAEEKLGTTDFLTETQSTSKWQQLKPLFLIFFYIFTASILLNIKPWSTSSFMLDFMGLFYIVFSFFKMLDLKGFPDSFQMYDPLAKKIRAYAWIYPFIELALGLMFLFRFEIFIALIITLIILGLTTIGVTQSLFSKKKIKCACLGTALNLPMTEATFIENAIMIVMAIFMLLQYI